MKHSIFETEIIIRRDDIEINNHIHNSKYLDFVQAAGFIKMRDCYKITYKNFICLAYIGLQVL